MSFDFISKITEELNLTAKQVQVVIELLAGGATVPFIARYRKEATESLDEVAITNIRDRNNQLQELQKRRSAILSSLKERNKLTDELKEKITTAETLNVLEDIYLPFRPKRRTKATVAKEKGLQPLADIIFEQSSEIDLLKEAQKYLNDKHKLVTIDEVLAGARDIIAERINENAEIRGQMRELFMSKGEFRSKVIRGKEAKGEKFKDYFQWNESVVSCPSHRILAARRGEKESILMLRVVVDEAQALKVLEEFFVKGDNDLSSQVRLSVADSFKRLLSPSMETEVRLATKKRADKDATKIFSDNLRQLLMAPPLGQRAVLAIDPGYRTGCKVVCLDNQGQLLVNGTIFLIDAKKGMDDAEDLLKKYCETYKVECIAIGNGTASRETESFVRSLKLPNNPQVVLVNESGASIYSASEVARDEFPDQDITVRGAISIGRRLMDPLAELVKIDPKSIGVGQYQHDVDQNLLKRSLDDVVSSCVNSVGVEVNTASKQLLIYVSGLGPKMAQSIIEHRNQKGPFASREDLKSISGFGEKVFQQAAGFLRIYNAKNPLDGSAVHPESHFCVENMAKDLGVSIDGLMKNPSLHTRIKLENYVTETIGLPTLEDILLELAKPGRDPREQFEFFSFKEGVETLEDLKEGMVLPGIVTNITDFGAFVDIGVHHDGLVHISEMADKFVKRPADVVTIHQKVQVRVLDIEIERGRIALSMRKDH